MKALCITRGTLQSGRPARDWFRLGDDGRAGIGPWYEDGPTTWVSPGEPRRGRSSADRVIDSDDPESIRAEIAQFGPAHVRSFLRASGMAVAVESHRFNRCDSMNNCIDIEFDHPGSLAMGLRTTYECAALGLTWTSESS